MSLGQKETEIAQRAVVGVDGGVVGDVVTLVLQRRGTEGKEPNSSNAEVCDVIEFFRQAAKISDPVAVAVVVRADVDFVDDRVLVPQSVIVESRPNRSGRARSPVSPVPWHMGSHFRSFSVRSRTLLSRVFARCPAAARSAN